MTPKELITPAVNPAADPGWILHLGKKKKNYIRSSRLNYFIHVTICKLHMWTVLENVHSSFLILRAFPESPFFHGQGMQALRASALSLDGVSQVPFNSNLLNY